MVMPSTCRFREDPLAASTSEGTITEVPSPLIALPGEDIVRAGMDKVENRLKELLTDAARPPLPQVAAHLVNAGGKRIRPLLLLLSSRLMEIDEDQAIHLATASELIHSATLLHDDVVDESDHRRGRIAARNIWSNAFSVLAGDLCLSLALSEVERAGDMRAIRSLVETVRSMVSAEVIQLGNRGRFSLSKDEYFEIIRGKTASLLSWCASVGHLGDPEIGLLLSDYGRSVGLAFQIADDVLDYQASIETCGKTVGKDLAEGKLTLPVMEAMELEPSLSGLIEEIVEAAPDKEAHREIFRKVASIVCGCGAIERSCAEALRHAEQARKVLADLPESETKEVLMELALFAASRKA